MSNLRSYTLEARSTDTFGRVRCSSRNHHFIVDGPTQNGCPGEAITPVEVFLSGVAACGVELVEVIAKERSYPLGGVHVMIAGTVDRDRPVRSDYSVFNRIDVRFTLGGVTREQGEDLVESFKGR